MKNPRYVLSIVALVAFLVVAACGTPSGGVSDPPDSETVNSKINDSVSTVTGAMDDPAVAAVGSVTFDGFIFTSDAGNMSLLAALSDPRALADGIRTAADEQLPRGEYVWNETYYDWDLVTSAGDDLLFRWNYVDPNTSTTHDVEMTVDWDNSATGVVSATTEVYDPSSGLEVEVPTTMGIFMSVDSTTAASFEASFDWYAPSDASCTPTGTTEILDLASAEIDGFIGLGDLVELTGVGYDVTSTSVSSSGEIAVTVGADSASFDWNVSVTGTVVRDSSCLFTDINVTSGSVALGVDSETGGVTDSFDFTMTFDNLVYETDEFGYEVLVSADISGELKLNGRRAVTFSGTYDDEDGDLYYGENVTVTFADGTTTTLEAWLYEDFMSTSRR